MRVKDPYQAYVDQRQIKDFGSFLESLHECRTCGSLFDDSADMSETCIDTCLDCVVTAAAPSPEVRAMTGMFDKLEQAMETLNPDIEIKQRREEGQ